MTGRLTYNTWRRGLLNLYVFPKLPDKRLTAFLARISNDEDYRWRVVREKIPPWLFQLFNLTFIGKFQNCYGGATFIMMSSRDSKYYPLSPWCSH